MTGGKYRHVYSTNKGNSTGLSSTDHRGPMPDYRQHIVTLNPYEAVLRHLNLGRGAHAENGCHGHHLVKHVHPEHKMAVSTPVPSPTKGTMVMTEKPPAHARNYYYHGHHHAIYNDPRTIQKPQHNSGAPNPHGCAYKETQGLEPWHGPRAYPHFIGTRPESREHYAVVKPEALISTGSTECFQNSFTELGKKADLVKSEELQAPKTTLMRTSADLTDTCIQGLENLRFTRTKTNSDVSSVSPVNSTIDCQETRCDTENHSFRLDLSRIKSRYKTSPVKPKVREQNSGTLGKEGNRATRVSSGKPLHPYTAVFNDPVEKELERWHNTHCSTIKWKRVKRGVYTADDQEVHLVKLNGCLYVKGSIPGNKQDHIALDAFVQSVQANAG